MARRDHLRHRAHAHHVCADGAAQHPVLRRRLQAWPFDGHVDAALEPDLGAEREVDGKRAECRIVGIAHVWKARAPGVGVGAAERVGALQVDVVLDQHQIAAREKRVHAAGGVRHDERLDAQRSHHADGPHDLACRIPLVEVKPTLHGEHRHAAKRPRQKAPVVALDRREWHLGDLAVRHALRHLDLVGQSAETRSQDDADACLAPDALREHIRRGADGGDFSVDGVGHGVAVRNAGGWCDVECSLRDVPSGRTCDT